MQFRDATKEGHSNQRNFATRLPCNSQRQVAKKPFDTIETFTDEFDSSHLFFGCTQEDRTEQTMLMGGNENYIHFRRVDLISLFFFGEPVFFATFQTPKQYEIRNLNRMMIISNNTNTL